MASKEFFDIFDSNGNSAGRIKERSRVHTDGDWHRTVHVWIENGRGEILLAQRCSFKQTFPNKWDVSSAGHISTGDSSRQSAIREAKEELGITISPLELRSIGTVKTSFTQGPIHDNEISDIYVVRRDITADSCTIQKDEVAAVKLMQIRELERRIQAQDSEFVPHPEEYLKLFQYLRQLYPSAAA